MDPVKARCFHTERLIMRGYDELVGLCKGIIADGEVNPKEAQFLLNWLKAHPDASCNFPASTLANRLADMFIDECLDQDEAAELLFLLRELTGEEGQQGNGAMPTRLAFDDPMPNLFFRGQYFCLTGTFQSGQRKEISQKLESVGSLISSSVTSSRPCCLVVGSLVTEAWLYSTHGRKIEAAVAYRDNGSQVSVISEDHLWNELERKNLL